MKNDDQIQNALEVLEDLRATMFRRQYQRLELFDGIILGLKWVLERPDTGGSRDQPRDREVQP